MDEHPMPFPVLIDEDRSVIKAFDVYNPIGVDAFRIAHPSMFLVSAEGTILFAYVGENQADRPTDDLTYDKVNNLISDTMGDEED